MYAKPQSMEEGRSGDAATDATTSRALHSKPPGKTDVCELVLKNEYGGRRRKKFHESCASSDLRPKMTPPPPQPPFLTPHTNKNGVYLLRI